MTDDLGLSKILKRCFLHLLPPTLKPLHFQLRGLELVCAEKYTTLLCASLGLGTQPSLTCHLALQSVGPEHPGIGRKGGHVSTHLVLELKDPLSRELGNWDKCWGGRFSYRLLQNGLSKVFLPRKNWYGDSSLRKICICYLLITSTNIFWAPTYWVPGTVLEDHFKHIGQGFCPPAVYILVSKQIHK